jgi:hypothetical protein
MKKIFLIGNNYLPLTLINININLNLITMATTTTDSKLKFEISKKLEKLNNEFKKEVKSPIKVSADENLFSYFFNTLRKIVIDIIFQRNYKISHSTISKLMRDILNYREKDLSFNIGDIHIKGKPGESMIVVDGQQRLLTILLFYVCLYCNMKRLKRTYNIKDLNFENMMDNLSSVFNNLNVSRTKDSNDLTIVFKYMIENFEIITEQNILGDYKLKYWNDNSIYNLFENLVYINKEFNVYLNEPAFAQWLIKNINTTVVSIVSDKIKPNDVYQSINENKTNFDGFDNVKNVLISAISNENDKEEFAQKFNDATSFLNIIIKNRLENKNKEININVESKNDSKHITYFQYFVIKFNLSRTNYLTQLKTKDEKYCKDFINKYYFAAVFIKKIYEDQKYSYIKKILSCIDNILKGQTDTYVNFLIAIGIKLYNKPELLKEENKLKLLFLSFYFYQIFNRLDIFKTKTGHDKEATFYAEYSKNIMTYGFDENIEFFSSKSKIIFDKVLNAKLHIDNNLYVKVSAAYKRLALEDDDKFISAKVYLSILQFTNLLEQKETFGKLIDNLHQIINSERIKHFEEGFYKQCKIKKNVYEINPNINTVAELISKDGLNEFLTFNVKF